MFAFVNSCVEKALDPRLERYDSASQSEKKKMKGDGTNTGVL